jgi:Uma2 family endonuclease
MATVTPAMTIEKYLHTSYHPDVDFIDGSLQERNSGEFDHGHLHGLFFTWFLQRIPSTGLVPCNELRIRVSSDRVRICDVGVVHRENVREQVAVTPPAVCIEFLSPEDRLVRAQAVLSDYLTMGVGNIWLIDPSRRASYTFDRGELLLVPDNSLRIKGTELTIDVNAIFVALDELSA